MSLKVKKNYIYKYLGFKDSFRKLLYPLLLLQRKMGGNQREAFPLDQSKVGIPCEQIG